MKGYSMRPLTEASWLLSLNGDRLGMISMVDGSLRVIGRVGAGIHGSIELLEKALGGKITVEKQAEAQAEKEQAVIGGYPIKHAEYHNVENDPVPSYTRIPRPTSSRYAAGYYGLGFQHGWTASFCPKLVTLAEYDHIGPFTTKIEMQHQISAKNKSVNV